MQNDHIFILNTCVVFLKRSVFVSDLFYSFEVPSFSSIVLPSVANEDAEGSTRPQASFAREYQITTLSKFTMNHFCCYHNVLHVAGSLCGEMFKFTQQYGLF